MDNNRFETVPLKEESSNQIVDEDAVENGYQRLNNPQDIIEEDDDNTQLNDITGARGEITVTSTSSFGNKPMTNSDNSSDTSSDDDVPNQFSMSTGTGFSSLNSLITSKRMHVDPSTSLNSSSSSSSAGSNSNTQQEDNSSDNNDDEPEQEIGIFPGQIREATETPPTPEEQKKIISELITEESSKLAIGQVWYFVGLKWWDSFKNYIGYKEKQAFSSFEDSSSLTPTEISPGPIDNDELVINPEGAWQKPSHLVKLQRNVFEGYEFVYVSEDVWRKIHAWYGGGPTISRTVHITGFAKQLAIVNHPFYISVAVHRNKRQDVYHELSFVKSATLAEVKAAIIKYFRLEGEASSYRLWHMDDGKPRRAFSSLDDYKDLELVLLNDIGEKFKIETRNPDGSWPLQPAPIRPVGSVMHPGAASRSNIGSSRSMLLGPTSFSSRFRAGYDEDDDDDNNSKSSFGSNSGYGSSSKPGMSGLQNLGNTCFMNSGLQCLTKTPQIREYFTSGDYVKDVNAENPLGMKGRLAQAFGNLMRDMWSGKYGYVSPREFKHVVGQFAPQFSGYAQQDSQELLAYLLDGLHEDLNRVRKKPITEPVDSNNRPDEVVAKEAWERHLLRNDSVIVDKFQGQLKSTLECPKCNNISITFDPFMYLSLPLPMERTRYITVLVFKHDSLEAPTKYAVKVAKNGFIKEVKEKVGEIAGINPESLVIAEIFANKIHKTFQDKDISKDIMERDVIAAFEVPQLIQKVTIPQPVTNQTENMEINTSAGPTIEKPKIALVNVRIMYKQSSTSIYSNSRFTQYAVVGTPFILPVVFGSTTKKDLYDDSLSFVKKYIKPNLKEEYGFDISHPESLFPKPKSKKQKTSTSDEEEEEMDTSDDSFKNKATSVPPKSNDLDDIDIEENNNTDATNSATLSNQEATSSTMEEDQPPGLISPPTTVKRIADHLFNLTFDSGYSSYDAGNPIYYEDELVTKQDIQDGMYSKKSIAIIIDQKVLEQIVDNEKLENIIEDESAKPISEHNSQVKLEDCLQLFSTTEKLGPEDPWYCPKCKDHVQATKKMEIYSLPEVLVIHLKRFQYTRHIRDKIEAFVSFPLKGLDMSERNCQKMHSVYDLYAVSNHYGGMGGGHYTAFAKDPDSEKWYKCDDSYVSECSANDVQSPASYVLFYSRNKQTKEGEDKNEAITEDNNNNNNNSQPQSKDQE